MDKDLHLHENHKNQKHHKPKNDELFESLKDSPEFKRDIYRLGEVYVEFFGTDILGDYTCYTDEGKQCSDGSDLYTMIKYEGKNLIVKVGA